jgi:hypothetical protein
VEHKNLKIMKQKQHSKQQTNSPFGEFRGLGLLLFAGLLCLIIVSCNKDDNPTDDPNHPNTEEGIIEMQIKSYHEVTVYIYIVSKKMEINWGDGTIENYTSNGRDTIAYIHPYTSNGIECQVTIKSTELTHLDCRYIPLTKLDVSQNTTLTYLDCNQYLSYSNGGGLTHLDVSKNTALTYLECGWNYLTNLDVSKNTALTSLLCRYNQLTNLDVSKNTALTYLDCYYNPLANLDVSKNTALTYLRCGWNELTKLDVSKNTALTYLECEWNYLTNLDVSKNTALIKLYCNENQLTNLNVNECMALTSLNCSWNQLTTSTLNALFISLPVRVLADYARISIQVNPGEHTCDRSIAENKGWMVLY